MASRPVNLSWRGEEEYNKLEPPTPTPRPWRVEINDDGFMFIGADGRGIAGIGDMEDVDGEDSANAKFIVRACNAHDELVAVAQDALLIIYEIDQNFDVAIEIGGREITAGEVKERLIAVLKAERGKHGDD